MHVLGALTALFGIGLILLAWIGYLVAAFRTSVLWGIGVLVFPIVSLIFLIVEWERAKRPFFLKLWGIAFLLFGVLVLDWRP